MGRSRTRSTWGAVVVVAVLAAATAARSAGSADRTSIPADTGTLVASIRSEPRSFNRYTARDLSTAVVTLLLHDGLVRINRISNQLEPRLAERWELLHDQRTYRVRLRTGVRFSDGAPFTADDVVFSFKAIYDRAVGSSLAETLQVRGEPLRVAAEDAATVTIQFPSAFGPGLRMLDGVPVYPRHRLATALETGSFRSAWGLSTAPGDIVGAGPFVLRRYEPSQRLTFDRNPYYWHQDDRSRRADHVVLDVVPDQDAELLRLEAGDLDLTQSELRPFDVPALQRAGAGRLSITDAGIGLDGDLLWVNLSGAKARDPRSRWLQHPDFRRALSRAVDRRAFVDTVFLGEAVPADSIISPGNRQWHAEAPFPEYDVAEAKRLLASLGLSAPQPDGALRDARGKPVRFSLLTQKGNTALERGAAVIRDSLARVGVGVDVVTLEVGALIDYIRRGDYDAAYFRLLTTDSDPALNPDFWLSSGGAHIWNPEQRSPATAWESSIDTLMGEVSTATDDDRRHRLFAQVQRIVAREVPVLCFAFPRLRVAVSARVIDATPAPFRPPVLWNPDRISIRPAR